MLLPSQDLKQCDNWGLYLESLGWKTHRISNGAMFMTIKSPLGTLVKCQHPKALSKKDLAEIEEICRAQKALFIKLEPFVGQDMELMKACGYKVSNTPQCVPSTMYIDLTQTEEELWNKLSHSAKYSVNRSRREGDKVVFYKNPTKDVLKPYYAMCVETGRLKKFYVQPYKELDTRIKLFKDDAILSLVYDKNGKMASGKLYLGAGDLTLYTTGGTTRIGRSEKGGYLLMWESILYLKTAGYKVLDLEGMDDPRYPIFTKNWGGFAHFKEMFGGDVVRFPYPQIKYLSPVFKFMSRFKAFSL